MLIDGQKVLVLKGRQLMNISKYNNVFQIVDIYYFKHYNLKKWQ